MFWAMMYLLLFSGSAAHGVSFVPDETLLRKAIVEQPHLEQVMDIRDEITAAEQRLTDLYKNSYSELVSLSQQHETDSITLAAHFDELAGERAEIQEELINLRFRLKKQMTEKEWNTVFKNR